MPRIVAVHSYRGGTGKSNLVANLAVLLAQEGRRIGIIDADMQSPGIHALFKVDPKNVQHTLNDYLWDKCAIEATVQNVTGNINSQPAGNKAIEGEGQLFLIPSSMKVGEIAHVLKKGYDVDRFTDGLSQLVRSLHLDTLFIDTHPGLNEDTLLSMAIANAVLIILRPDQQDYQGTGVTISVARQLGVPNIFLVMNSAPLDLDTAVVKEQVQRTYQTPVVGVLPFCEELMTLASEDIFVLSYPQHPFTAALKSITEQIR